MQLVFSLFYHHSVFLYSVWSKIFLDVLQLLSDICDSDSNMTDVWLFTDHVLLILRAKTVMKKLILGLKNRYMA